MPLFGVSQFEKLLAKATDEAVTEPDWMAMMAMCDLVRQQEMVPSAAISAIRKQLFNRNSHVVVFTLLVLECLVKNCGQPVHEEIAQYEFLEELKEIVRTGYSTVRGKVLSLIAAWNKAFKGEPRYSAVREAYDALKAEGFQFPELNESEDLFDATRAPEWEDGRMCHLCRQQFTMTKRKHHCRNCGQIFCAECTAERMPLPHYGIEKEVRVCSICADKVGKGKIKAAAEGGAADSRQPATNPQASGESEDQTKKKQKDLELKEKEELELALALSLSQQDAQPSSSRAPDPVSSAPKESAPAENLYAEVEHIKPEPVQSYYPDLNNTPVLANGPLYPAMDMTPKTTVQQTLVPVAVTSVPTVVPAVVQPVSQPPNYDTDDYAQQVKDLTEMLMRKLNMAAMKGQHVGTDPHIQTLLASLTALHPRLVNNIEDTERKMNAQKTLLTKIATCKQARESLNQMREEHLAKVRQQEEEQTVLMRLQMEQKLELLRQQKLEQLKYQEELKRKHEQALFESRTIPRMGAYPQQPLQHEVVMTTHVNPSNYVNPQQVPPTSSVPETSRPTSTGLPGQPYPGFQHGYQHLPQLRNNTNYEPAPLYQNFQVPPQGVPTQGTQAGPVLSAAQGVQPEHSQPLPPQSQPLPLHSQPMPAHLQPMPAHSQPMQAHSQPLPPHSQHAAPPGQHPIPNSQHPQGMYGSPPPMYNMGPPPSNYSGPQYSQPPPPVSSVPQETQQPIQQEPPVSATVSQPQAPLTNQQMMSALEAAPAPPSEPLPAPQVVTRRSEPPVADLISF